ncbi:MAG TPA: glycosyltransferase family 1 protein [Candidatus Angelobacter sp.]|jgi:glycosyltransferase involved in cell wall biosynthesis|nr:glycosyltransferase family 1 protein [Candidatus Angelobacter sp.]
MRVGFDARWYNDSGVGTYVSELLRAMARIPHGAELVVYEDPANQVPGLIELPVERIALRSSKYSLSEQFELSQRQRKDRLDVFHSPFYVVPWAIGCPVVVTLHDLIPFLFDIDPWPKRFLVKIGYHLAVRRSSHVITVSRHTANDVVKILRGPRERISVIHNAASSSEFHERSTGGELIELQNTFGIRPPYVLAASAWNWRTKNLGTALDALTLVRQRSGREFQTVIYGPREGVQALGGKDKYNHLDLLTTGHVTAHDLGMIFRHARFFIMPALYEGFGLPVLEAMTCGCAVITSNGGSLAEVAGNGAQVFDPLDSNSMAEAAIELLCNPEVLKKWQQLALRRSTDFSWTRAAQETISIYHRVNAQNIIRK